MNIREETEAREAQFLCQAAQQSALTRGRRDPEEKDTIRTDFQRDRDRILHSKAFRRLKHKTQVFISPEGDHYRTRLTHTLEVSQIARTMARALRLNEDLIEAMALGHDVGHTPFGHAGEEVLRDLLPGFTHYHQSVRVLEFLETTPKRRGLNLTWEVLDGIANHSGDNEAATLEGRLLKFADRIAYINHDIDDSIRAGVLSEEELPKEATRVLGHTSSQRIATMVCAVIEASRNTNTISMQEEVRQAAQTLRAFMFREVYTNALVKGENEKLKHIIEDVFAFYMQAPDRLPESHRALYTDTHAEDSLAWRVGDYIAGMTDLFLIHTYEDLFIPQVWKKM
uniref:deoxyguanosinetriphosphate triphosphohydrolase n=1 Tax=Ndongobacter massiliensis TaxID=1871025 RepID=UPI000930A7CE|nr:deoxyguanosinetriphosphate triphosphohydrolase [Ndongobacter massiliensis]